MQVQGIALLLHSLNGLLTNTEILIKKSAKISRICLIPALATKGTVEAQVPTFKFWPVMKNRNREDYRGYYRP